MNKSSVFISEFVGTFLLVLTVGCNVLSGQAMWGGVSVASVLMVTIYALAPISGAHFNPAVSVCLAMTRPAKFEWVAAGVYCAVQVAGGIAAAWCYSLLYWDGHWDTLELSPAEGFGWMSACLCETLYTFMLCFVVLNVAISRANDGKHQFYGLAIGFVIVAGAYGAGAVSGGCFNPAVAIGIDIGSFRMMWSVPYVISEIIGAALASAAFRLVRPGDFEEMEGAEPDLKAKVFSEFLGTYFLVVTVGLNIMAKSPAAAFSIAASLMCMIFALGDVSGAHFNPAVTAAVRCIGQIDTKTALVYVVVQVMAGFAAAATYLLVYAGRGFALGPAVGWAWAAVGVAEVVFTFVLCFIVLMVVHSPKNNLSEFFGLAIGSCVTVGGFAIGPISGGSLNPAVSFGIAFGDLGRSLGEATLYSVFELLGALLAVGAFMATHADGKGQKEDRARLGPEDLEPALGASTYGSHGSHGS
jgi:aquaporin Z